MILRFIRDQENQISSLEDKNTHTAHQDFFGCYVIPKAGQGWIKSRDS